MYLRWFGCFFCSALLALAGPALADREADVVAWETFMEAARDAGSRFLRDHSQGSDVERATALMYMTQQLAVSVQQSVADADTSLPLLRLGATNINKWGLDSADARYLGAALRDDGTYRLFGTLGSAKLSAIQVVMDYPHFQAHASLDGSELEVDADGRFEVRLGRGARPDDWHGPWLPIAEGANRLLIREYFGDWTQESPGAWTLERMDAGRVEAAKRADVAAASQQLGEMVDRFAYRLNVWMPWLATTRTERLNTLQQLTPSGQGLQNNVYGEGWFSLANDEVLLIVLDAPDADLWSLQLGNIWWESLDYIHRTGSINGSQAQPDPDGRYRIIVGSTDPGYANWLDTGGAREGAMMYRYLNSRTAPVPQVLLLPVGQLVQYMPAGAVEVLPAERARQTTLRRQGALKRWSP